MEDFSSPARKLDEEIQEKVIRDASVLSSKDILKLQQENIQLKKDMQAMESKLKSNMKSIKTFWSPELKKEKAAKIEQENKFLALHQQYTCLSKEAQVQG